MFHQHSAWDYQSGFICRPPLLRFMELTRTKWSIQEGNGRKGWRENRSKTFQQMTTAYVYDGCFQIQSDWACVSMHVWGSALTVAVFCIQPSVCICICVCVCVRLYLLQHTCLYVWLDMTGTWHNPLLLAEEATSTSWWCGSTSEWAVSHSMTPLCYAVSWSKW